MKPRAHTLEQVREGPAEQRMRPKEYFILICSTMCDERGGNGAKRHRLQRCART